MELRNESGVSLSEERKMFLESARKEIEAGMSIQEVAEYVFQAIISEQLFVLTHREYDSILRDRLEDILR